MTRWEKSHVWKIYNRKIEFIIRFIKNDIIKTEFCFCGGQFRADWL